jgi:hypothetical protein
MTIKPKWVQWDAVGFASDPKVQNLHPDKWKGFYFLLLNSLAIDGEIEWDEEDLVERFGSDASGDAKATLRKVRKLFSFFTSRTEDGRVFISHPKMDQAREHFFNYIEQKKIAGRKGGLVRQTIKSDDEASSKRRSSDASSSAQAPPKRVDLDLDLDLSLTNRSPDQDKDRSIDHDLSPEQREKREQEERGLRWVESLPKDGADLIAETIESIQATRSGGKIAPGLMKRILFRLSEHEWELVEDACRKYVEKHNGKPEAYLFGIIRNLKKERGKP